MKQGHQGQTEGLDSPVPLVTGDRCLLSALGSQGDGVGGGGDRPHVARGADVNRT